MAVKNPEINCIQCGKPMPHPVLHPSLAETVVSLTCGCGVDLEMRIVGTSVSIHNVLRLSGSTEHVAQDRELINAYGTNLGTLLGSAAASRFRDTVKLVVAWAAAKSDVLDKAREVLTKGK